MVDVWGMNVGKQKRSSHGSIMGFDVTHPQHPQHQMDLCFFGEKVHVFFGRILF